MPMTTGQRETQLRLLSESMRRANVPEDAITQVVAEQARIDTFLGYVTRIEYDDNRDQTVVNLFGEGGLELHFPPNSPKFLPELVRAQTHPHLAVNIAYKSTETFPVILALSVNLDYPLPWPNNKPPFDDRTLSAPQNTTATTGTSSP
jgi:hypothetical protein